MRFNFLLLHRTQETMCGRGKFLVRCIHVSAELSMEDGRSPFLLEQDSQRLSSVLYCGIAERY